MLEARVVVGPRRVVGKTHQKDDAGAGLEGSAGNARVVVNQVVMAVPVTRERLGELVAERVAIRVLTSVVVAEACGAAEPLPAGEWPAELRQIIKDARRRLPAPVAVPVDDPRDAATRIARHIPGGEVVELAPASPCSGPNEARPT